MRFWVGRRKQVRSETCSAHDFTATLAAAGWAVPPELRYRTATEVTAENRLGEGNGPPTNDQAKKSGAVTPRHPVVQGQDLQGKGSTVLALSRTLCAGSADCRRIGGGILDCHCARRSARRQVGTKGWPLSIEQRDGRRMLTRRRRREPRSWGRTASAVRAGCRPPTASGRRRCAGRGRGCGRAGAARHNGGG